jgi:hypothetical protein
MHYVFYKINAQSPWITYAANSNYEWCYQIYINCRASMPHLIWYMC